jgi:ATP-dependent Clp protease ATP-binding subunit ClpB
LKQIQAELVTLEEKVKQLRDLRASAVDHRRELELVRRRVKALEAEPSKADEDLLHELRRHLKTLEKNDILVSPEKVHHVSADSVAEVVSRKTGLPVSRVMSSEKEKLVNLESTLAECVRFLCLVSLARPTTTNRHRSLF